MHYRNWSGDGKNAVIDWIRRDHMAQGVEHPPIVRGILDGKAKALMGTDPWLYVDHAYFQRGYAKGNLRCIRSGFHLTEMLDRPKDRLKKFGVKIEPWRKKGQEIIIIPPSDAQKAIYENDDWLCSVETKLCEVTERPVRCKSGKLIDLREFCKDAWAVVTYASVAGVEASLMGLPVFSTEKCPSWPVNAGRLEDIETPNYSDAREEWAAGLTYATWNVNELRDVKWLDYHYERVS